MGLTGAGFSTLSVIVALVAVVACVRLLPRYSGRVFARAGLLVGTQIVLLVALLVVVNSGMRFYSTWADLFGADTGRARIIDRSPAASPSAKPWRDVLARRLPAGQGHLDALTVHGMRSGISVGTFVYVPPRYVRGMPVVLFLASPPEMIKRRFPQFVAGQIAAGRLHPALFVIAPTSHGCVDAPGGRQAETFLTQDLPTAISAAYRTGGAPARW